MGPTPQHWLFMGNPGSGKSTLLNCLLGVAAFDAGLSFGSGRTQTAQYVNLTNDIILVDTPGVTDVKMRPEACTAITSALKKGGVYKLFFVLTLRNGRVSPEDVTTYNEVLRSIGDQDVKFSLLVNNVDKKQYAMLTDPQIHYPLTGLSGSDFSTASIMYIPTLADLDEEENAVVGVADLHDFAMDAPACFISPEKVGKINTEADVFESKSAELSSDMAMILQEKDVLKNEVATMHNKEDGVIGRMVQKMSDVATRTFGPMHSPNDKPQHHQVAAVGRSVLTYPYTVNYAPVGRVTQQDAHLSCGELWEPAITVAFHHEGVSTHTASQDDSAAQPLPPYGAGQNARMIDTQMLFGEPESTASEMVIDERPSSVWFGANLGGVKLTPYGWRLRRQDAGLVVEWTPVEHASTRLGVVRTTAEASTLARRFLHDSRVTFERHVWLDAPYALWAGVAAPTASAARDLLSSDHAGKRDAEQAARARRWSHADSTIAVSLESVSWSKVMQTPGAPASHRLLFHKLKGDRLTGWDRLNVRRGCPHCPAIGGDGGSAFHLAWGCRHASARWQQLRDFWAPLYTRLPRLHDGQLKTDVFSLRLAVLPDALWSHPELARLGEPTVHDTTATTLALQSVWRRHVLATLSEIWKRRTAPDSSADQWTDREAQARHGASLQAVLHGLRWARVSGSAATKFTAAALDVLFGSQGPPPQPEPAPSPAEMDSYVLFFDGGSRGNPGPGGAGAVIIRVDGGRTRASVIWSAAMSLQDARTTNNQAEYHGLLTGLNAARRNAWAPLEVVGDSQLILRQMEQYRPPTNKRLLASYAAARRVADTLRVRQWHHHYRACNKMADAAANVAMDAAASSQVFHPTTRPEHANIAAFLPSDFAQWQVVHFSS